MAMNAVEQKRAEKVFRQKKQRRLVIFSAVFVTIFFAYAFTTVLLWNIFSVGNMESSNSLLPSGDGNETIRIINIVLEDPFYLFSETVLPLNILSDGLVPDEDDRLNGVADEVFIQFVTLNVEIVPSVVSEVRVMLMNRTDSLTKLLRQTEVSLCDNQENCNYACGQLSGEFNSWASVTCNHLIESREAKIKFDPTFSLYEIQVRGNVIVDDAVRNVNIRRGIAYGHKGEMNDTEISKVLDGEMDWSDCFLSEKTQRSWVSLQIPWSRVTHVDLLNTDSKKLSTLMEGTFVDVCSYGIKCTPCGVVTLTDPLKWAGVYCTGGIVAGNEIQLRHAYNPLLICGIKVFGKLSDDDKNAITMIEIQDAFVYSYDLKERVSSRFLHQTYDKIWFKSNFDVFSPSAPAHYNISRARVTHVNFLRGYASKELDGSFPIEGASVHLCEDINMSSCSFCGNISDIPYYTWASVFCANKDTPVELVKITPFDNGRSEALSLSEVEIFGLNTYQKL